MIAMRGRPSGNPVTSDELGGPRLKDFFRKEVAGEDFDRLEESEHSQGTNESEFLATLSRKEKKKLLRRLERNEKKESARKRRRHSRSSSSSSASSSSSSSERRPRKRHKKRREEEARHEKDAHGKKK